ncbi:hypothetical protein KUTeg_002325 [Tegillarca granosa]|uniref:C2H2-type domain-containing protein n=1 Tax=Tegillarca granosa TaxID=220873 RepID=A0ABQ9FU09_TEGGR|nr:hypothetical protein KUTeg_002325 [Tegillarca granosa]
MVYSVIHGLTGTSIELKPCLGMSWYDLDSNVARHIRILYLTDSYLKTKFTDNIYTENVSQNFQCWHNKNTSCLATLNSNKVVFNLCLILLDKNQKLPNFTSLFITFYLLFFIFGQPRITISQGCITSTTATANTPILLKPTPVGAGGRTKDELKNNTDFIRSVLHQQKQNSFVSGSGKQLTPDYSTYLKRFNNGQECGVKYCKELSYREHFHCMDCNFRVFIKKEEMVRHYKWHRKREESLQHGFMRYSPMDDCSQNQGKGRYK